MPTPHAPPPTPEPPGTGRVPRARDASGGDAPPPVAVVICVYTLDRIADIEAAVASVRAQTLAPAELVVVVDHNDELLDVLHQRLHDVTIVASSAPAGLSGARNSGVAATTAPVVAFLDDDAVASPTWLTELVAPFGDPCVEVTGGRAVPRWVEGAPRWFPDEFGWVVGCSFRGQTIGEARNPLGCNMAIRRDAIARVGGFDGRVGRTARNLAGGEETELALHIRASRPDSRILVLDGAVVEHTVPASRGRWRYFLRRCRDEGASKALVFTATTGDAGAVERAYLTRVLPRAVVAEIARGRPGRAFAIVAGTAATGLGFVTETLRRRFRRHGRS